MESFQRQGLVSCSIRKQTVCMPGVCPVATRSLGLNSLAMCVNLHDLKYTGFSQSAFQQQGGCLRGDGMRPQQQG